MQTTLLERQASNTFGAEYSLDRTLSIRRSYRECIQYIYAVHRQVEFQVEPSRQGEPTFSYKGTGIHTKPHWRWQVDYTHDLPEGLNLLPFYKMNVSLVIVFQQD